MDRPGDVTEARRGGIRTRARLCTFVGLAGLTLASLASPVEARPANPAGIAKADRAAGTVGSQPPALASLPRNSTYARQILQAVDPARAEPPRADVIEYGGLLDRGTKASLVAHQAALLGQLVPARIAELYQQYLGRDPDPSGAGYWRGVVRGGGSFEGVAIGLATSAEGHRRAGPGTAAFVDYAYDRVLGRDADPSGRAFWIRWLDGGRSERKFIDHMLHAKGRMEAVVREAYLRYLRRPADRGGLDATVHAYDKRVIGELDLAGRLLGSREARRSGCDPFDTRNCVLPFPNDLFTIPDPTTGTGRRVAFKPEWSPVNDKGKAADPTEWNRNDGFSVGQAALVRVPGIDLAQTGAAPLTDIGASLDADAPIVVIDADSGERHPVFVELDAAIPEADRAQDQLLFVRPAVNYEPGHRYIVAMRDLRDGSGAVLDAPEAFRVYRDDDHGVTEVPRIEDRRPHMDQILDELEGAGIGRDDLYLAWDFTVASTANTTGRLLAIRDQALASLDGGAPDFDVTKVTDAPTAGVARRIEGTFSVPLYLTGDGGPGNAFTQGPDGLPTRNGSYTAGFDCEIANQAMETPARPVVYGHGLFGDLSEVRSSGQRAMVTRFGMAYCATDWIGMSENDVGNAVNVIHDVSTFKTLVDRSQQGILNTIFLGRLMHHDDGFVSHAAFQNGSGEPLLDTSALFYDGNSQGAVIGGAYLAVSPDATAGVLGVAGMNYSTLLDRSVDFDPFRAIMETTYLDPVDRVVGLQLIQMLWDRGETNGYAAYIAEGGLPATPAKRVLVHVALGDHQVATLTAEVEARTIGIPVHRPAYLPGRSPDVEPAWDLPAIDYPSSGPGGLIIWDSGAALAPLENVPPRTGPDPHSDPRQSVKGQEQKDAFLRSDGTLIDVCDGAACTTPAT